MIPCDKKMENVSFLKTALEHQTIMLHVIRRRFSTLDYMFTQYNADNLGTFSPFIIEAMHVYKQSVIIDLCKLFIVPNEKHNDISRRYRSSQKNNFYYITNKYISALDINLHNQIIGILQEVEDEIELITVQRDKELAHKDTDHNPLHSFTLDHFNILPILIKKGKEIIDQTWRYFGTQYAFDNFDNKNVAHVVEVLRADRQKFIDDTITQYKDFTRRE